MGNVMGVKRGRYQSPQQYIGDIDEEIDSIDDEIEKLQERREELEAKKEQIRRFGFTQPSAQTIRHLWDNEAQS